MPQSPAAQAHFISQCLRRHLQAHNKEAGLGLPSSSAHIPGGTAQDCRHWWKSSHLSLWTLRWQVETSLTQARGSQGTSRPEAGQPMTHKTLLQKPLEAKHTHASCGTSHCTKFLLTTRRAPISTTNILKTFRHFRGGCSPLRSQPLLFRISLARAFACTSASYPDCTGSKFSLNVLLTYAHSILGVAGILASSRDIATEETVLKNLAITRSLKVVGTASYQSVC